MTETGFVYCTNCGKQLTPGGKFCIGCGKPLHPISLSSIPMTEEAPSNTVVASVFPTVTINTDGNLPICPKCGCVRLVWEKQAAPGWALPMCIAGIVMIFTFILGIPGIIIWAIGMYGLLKPRIVSPYCPQCRLFFLSTRDQNAGITSR